MKSLKKIFRTIKNVIIAALWVIIAGTVVHELGHLAGIIFFKVPVTEVVIAPGIRIYPQFKKIELQKAGFKANLIFDSDLKRGGVEIAGCVTTAVVSIIMSVLLLIFSKVRRKKLCWLTSLFYLDIVFYTFFPYTGRRHWFFFGSNVAEPLNGAKRLGIDAKTFLISVGVFFFIQTIFLIWLRRKKFNN